MAVRFETAPSVTPMSLRLVSSTLVLAFLALACGSSADGDDGSPHDGDGGTSSAGNGATAGTFAAAGSGASHGGMGAGGSSAGTGIGGAGGGGAGLGAGGAAPNGGAGSSAGGAFGGAGSGSGTGGSAMDAGAGGLNANGGAGLGGMGGRGFGGRSGAGGAFGGAGRGAGGRGGGGMSGTAGMSAAGTSGMTDCPAAGHVTYTLTKNANPTADEQQAYDLITEAMDKAVDYYNCYTNITKATTVTYVPSVDTADGNSNGSIRFGGREYMEYITAMHEIAHTVGIGTVSQWAPLVQNGIFTGAQATAKLREITGIADDQVHADSQHFWPYGLNYTSEVKSEADVINHCYIVVAIRADMGLN